MFTRIPTHTRMYEEQTNILTVVYRIIPGGWIHAVYTPVSAVCVSGNFWTNQHLGMCEFGFFLPFEFCIGVARGDDGDD